MKISYANMKLKVNTDVNTFNFCDQKVQVLKYLPAQDKYDLLMVTLQKSMQEDGFFNEFKLNIYFELNLVYLYTNISFTEKQRDDQFKLYDNLKSNGFFDLFYAAIDENEYQELLNWLSILKKDSMNYKMSIKAIANNLIDDLPAKVEAAAQMVDGFNPEKYQNVIDFARYANGDRDIKTNRPVLQTTY